MSTGVEELTGTELVFYRRFGRLTSLILVYKPCINVLNNAMEILLLSHTNATQGGLGYNVSFCREFFDDAIPLTHNTNLFLSPWFTLPTPSEPVANNEHILFEALFFLHAVFLILKLTYGFAC